MPRVCPCSVAVPGQPHGTQLWPAVLGETESGSQLACIGGSQQRDAKLPQVIYFLMRFLCVPASGYASLRLLSCRKHSCLGKCISTLGLAAPVVAPHFLMGLYMSCRETVIQGGKPCGLSCIPIESGVSCIPGGPVGELVVRFPKFWKKRLPSRARQEERITQWPRAVFVCLFVFLRPSCSFSWNRSHVSLNPGFFLKRTHGSCFSEKLEVEEWPQ